LTAYDATNPDHLPGKCAKTMSNTSANAGKGNDRVHTLKLWKGSSVVSPLSPTAMAKQWPTLANNQVESKFQEI
jgi:hypothetical protein